MPQQPTKDSEKNAGIANQGQPASEKPASKQEEGPSEKSWLNQSNKSPDDFPDNFDE